MRRNCHNLIRREHERSAISSLLVTTVTVLLATAWATLPPLDAHGAVAFASDVGPVANGGDDYDDTLEEMKRRLDEAAEEVFTGNWAGDLGEGMSVFELINRAEERLELILDPSQEPSLDPPDAGEVDPHVQPVGLDEHAMACCVLALDAMIAARTDPEASYEIVGTKLRTIRSLLPEYRRLLGQ
jgi:hypothetical protein